MTGRVTSSPGSRRGDAAQVGRRPADGAAWTAFCQALYASAEFRYLD